MQRTLFLGRRGQSAVGNGALVGAVLVRDGRILAEGYHHGFGLAHAERDMLGKFEQKIDSTDTLYVNLEPCCHHGKQPPCTELLLERGVRRVVYGMRDPDERVAGKGIETLRSQGVEVIGPVLPELCARLNRGFVSVRTKGRPWITLKQARTMDGRIAREDGSPLKITSPAQDRWAHTHLRARHDAILVGVQTIITDNPRLDCRFAESENPSTKIDQYQPWRIILDPHLRIPLSAKVVSDAQRERTIVLSAKAGGPVDRELGARGVRVMHVPVWQGIYSWPHLWEALVTLRDGYQGCTSILVEGGKRTGEVFRDAGMIDEEVILVGKIHGESEREVDSR